MAQSIEACSAISSVKDAMGSFHVISTQKKPDPLGFLQKLVTIRYLVSDDATPILGSPHQVFLDLWPFLWPVFHQFCGPEMFEHSELDYLEELVAIIGTILKHF